MDGWIFRNTQFELVAESCCHIRSPRWRVSLSKNRNQTGTGPDRFHISTDTWKEIHAGADPTRAARHLLEAGLLTPGDRDHLQKRLPASAVKERPRAYAVKRTILGMGDDDD
jgi:hypothetical protein